MSRFHTIIILLSCLIGVFLVLFNTCGGKELGKAVLCMSIPILVCVVFLYFLKTENLSKWDIFTSFLFGSSSCIIIVWLIREVVRSWFGGYTTNEIINRFLYAAQEELVKFAFIAPFLFRRKVKLSDLLVITWAVALGFTLLEDIHYIAKYSSENIVWKRIFTMPCHAAYTMILSTVSYVACKRKYRTSIGAFFFSFFFVQLGFIGSSIFHFAWNTFCNDGRLVRLFIILVIQSPVLVWSLSMMWPGEKHDKLALFYGVKARTPPS